VVSAPSVAGMAGERRQIADRLALVVGHERQHGVAVVPVADLDAAWLGHHAGPVEHHHHRQRARVADGDHGVGQLDIGLDQQRSRLWDRAAEQHGVGIGRRPVGQHDPPPSVPMTDGEDVGAEPHVERSGQVVGQRHHPRRADVARVTVGMIAEAAAPLTGNAARQPTVHLGLEHRRADGEELGAGVEPGNTAGRVDLLHGEASADGAVAFEDDDVVVVGEPCGG
jgi:hypothetical protein